MQLSCKNKNVDLALLFGTRFTAAFCTKERDLSTTPTAHPTGAQAPGLSLLRVMKKKSAVLHTAVHPTNAPFSRGSLVSGRKAGVTGNEACQSAPELRATDNSANAYRALLKHVPSTYSSSVCNTCF